MADQTGLSQSAVRKWLSQNEIRMHPFLGFIRYITPAQRRPCGEEGSLELQQFEPVDDTFAGASETDVERIEASIGARLPEEFRIFHMRFGWCGFAGDATAALLDGKRVPVSTFFGGGFDRGSLLRDMKSHGDFASEMLVPIATDDFNNRFVLDGKRSFAVFFDRLHAAAARDAQGSRFIFRFHCPH